MNQQHEFKQFISDRESFERVIDYLESSSFRDAAGDRLISECRQRVEELNQLLVSPLPRAA